MTLLDPKYKLVLYAWVVFLLLGLGYNFGQREHILMIFFWPYLLCAIISVQSKPATIPKYFRLLIGLLLGLFILLKPQFVILWWTIEIYLLIVGRSFLSFVRLENIGVMIGLIITSLFSLVVFPQYLVLLLQTSSVYAGFYTGNPLLVRKETSMLILGLIPSLMVIPQANFWKIKYLLACTVISSWLVALVQQKGYTHHFYPVAALVSFYIVYVTANYFGWRKANAGDQKLLKKITTAALAAPIIVWSLVPIFSPIYTHLPPVFIQGRSELDMMKTVVNKYTTEDSFAALATDLTLWALIERDTEVPWGLPYYNSWVLPGSYTLSESKLKPFPYHTYEQMADVEKQYFDSMLNTLLNKPPSVLFIQVSEFKTGFGHTSFDFYEYFSQDVRFSQSMKKYQYLGKNYFNRFDTYILKSTDFWANVPSSDEP